MDGTTVTTTTSPRLPVSARILQLATASWMSAAVSAVATLGVADELTSGPRSASDIAEAVDADPDALYRLLRACVDIDLFQEVGERKFALTELGAALCIDAQGSMRNFAMWVGLPADRHTWSDLARCICSGRSAFAGVHGEPIWDYLRARPEVAQVFDNAMTEASRGLVAPIVEAYDFTPFGTIVDVAGGHGALLAAVLATSPLSRGVLHDQPEVIAGAGPRLREAGVGDRTVLAGGDFLESVPAGGDAYLLSNVVHDWDDASSVRILTNCREAMAEGGRVLLVEAVMPEAGTSSLTVKLMDLNMLVLCDGRQRTAAEFGALLTKAGLELSRIVPVGLHSIVEAVRA
jgi:O-methyltransferase domain/Dimerisation domain